MWNKFLVIWHGVSGHFRGYHAVESRYWLFVIGSIVSLVILLVNSSVSFSFYRYNVMTKAVGLDPTSSYLLAVLLTFVLAFAAWVLLAFLAYLFSARLNKRKRALVGISKSDVFFSLLGVLFLAGLDVYANLHGVEEIALQSTAEHVDDPTAKVDANFQTERTAMLQRLDMKRASIQAEIDIINKWTGKPHSCTKTNCPTRKQGKGTIGAHWKGTLTAFGSQQLEAHKRALSDLDTRESQELAQIDKRRAEVSRSLIGAYQADVSRYHSELSQKNRTLKGFVLIAYPFSFVIEFLLAGICFIALEYLYETAQLERPTVSVYQNGEFDTGSTILHGERGKHKKPHKARGKKRGGYEIECLNCGKRAVKNHPRAKFCSDACRYEHHAQVVVS